MFFCNVTNSPLPLSLEKRGKHSIFPSLREMELRLFFPLFVKEGVGGVMTSQYCHAELVSASSVRVPGSRIKFGMTISLITNKLV